MLCARASPGADRTAAPRPAAAPLVKKSRRLTALSSATLLSVGLGALRPVSRFLDMFSLPEVYLPATARFGSAGYDREQPGAANRLSGRRQRSSEGPVRLSSTSEPKAEIVQPGTI